MTEMPKRIILDLELAMNQFFHDITPISDDFNVGQLFIEDVFQLLDTRDTAESRLLDYSNDLKNSMDHDGFYEIIAEPIYNLGLAVFNQLDNLGLYYENELMYGPVPGEEQIWKGSICLTRVPLEERN